MAQLDVLQQIQLGVGECCLGHFGSLKNRQRGNPFPQSLAQAEMLLWLFWLDFLLASIMEFYKHLGLQLLVNVSIDEYIAITSFPRVPKYLTHCRAIARTVEPNRK